MIDVDDFSEEIESLNNLKSYLENSPNDYIQDCKDRINNSLTRRTFENKADNSMYQHLNTLLDELNDNPQSVIDRELNRINMRLSKIDSN